MKLSTKICLTLVVWVFAALVVIGLATIGITGQIKTGNYLKAQMENSRIITGLDDFRINMLKVMQCEQALAMAHSDMEIHKAVDQARARITEARKRLDDLQVVCARSGDVNGQEREILSLLPERLGQVSELMDKAAMQSLQQSITATKSDDLEKIREMQKARMDELLAHIEKLTAITQKRTEETYLRCAKTDHQFRWLLIVSGLVALGFSFFLAAVILVCVIVAHRRTAALQQ